MLPVLPQHHRQILQNPKPPHVKSASEGAIRLPNIHTGVFRKDAYFVENDDKQKLHSKPRSRAQLSAYLQQVKSMERFLLRVLKIARQQQPKDLTSFILDALYTNERSLKAHLIDAPLSSYSVKAKRYNKDVIDPLLSDMMAKLVLEQPSEPKGWMIQYLLIRQRKQASQTSINDFGMGPSWRRKKATNHLTNSDFLKDGTRQGDSSSVNTRANASSSSSVGSSSWSSSQQHSTSFATNGPSSKHGHQRRKSKVGQSAVVQDPENGLKPHIAIAPPHNELLIIFQSLLLEKSDVLQGKCLNFGAMNPLFLQQRFTTDVSCLVEHRHEYYDAFMRRDLDKMDTLLGHGFVQPDDVLVGDWTALMAATRFGWTEVVELLLIHGASPLTARPNDELIPLFLAVMSQNIEMIDVLLNWQPPYKSSSNVNAYALPQLSHTLQKSTGENIIGFTARKGFYQVLEHLLVTMQKLRIPKRIQRKLINAVNNRQTSALFKAVLDGRSRVVQILSGCRLTDLNCGAFLLSTNKPRRPTLPLSPAERDAKAARKAARGGLSSEEEEEDSNSELLIDGQTNKSKERKSGKARISSSSGAQKSDETTSTVAGQETIASKPASSDSGKASSSLDADIRFNLLAVEEVAVQPDSGLDCNQTILLPLASPLQAAVALGKTKIAKYLIKQGAFVGGRIPSNPWTSGNQVTSSNSLDILELASLCSSFATIETLCTRCTADNFEDPVSAFRQRTKKKKAQEFSYLSLAAEQRECKISRSSRSRWFIDHNSGLPTRKQSGSSEPQVGHRFQNRSIADRNVSSSVDAQPRSDNHIIQGGQSALDDLSLFRLGFPASLVATGGVPPPCTFTNIEVWNLQKRQGSNLIKDPEKLQQRPAHQTRLERERDNITAPGSSQRNSNSVQGATVKETAIEFWYMYGSEGGEAISPTTNKEPVQWSSHLDRGTRLLFYYCHGNRESSWIDPRTGFDVDSLLGVDAAVELAIQEERQDLEAYEAKQKSGNTKESNSNRFDTRLYAPNNSPNTGHLSTNDEGAIGNWSSRNVCEATDDDEESMTTWDMTLAGDEDEDDRTLSTNAISESPSVIGESILNSSTDNQLITNGGETHKDQKPDPHAASMDYFDNLVDTFKTRDEGIDELCVAAQNDDAKAIQALLDRGSCSINAKGSKGRTPLMVAASYGCDLAVKALLNYHLNQRHGARQAVYAANEAPPKSFPAAVERWQRRSVCDANIKSVDGLTALILAAYAGQGETVRILIRRHTDPPSTTPLGITEPLRQHVKQTSMNLAAIAEEDAEFNENYAPVEADHNIQMSEQIKKIPIMQHQDNSPAIHHWWPAVQNMLGVDINVTLPSGATSLHLAVQQGHLNVVQVLTDMGLDGQGPCPAHKLLDLHNRNGQTSLSMSAERNRDDMMKLLLASKASINLPEKSKLACTPLICAAKLGHCNAISCLLRHGANLNNPASDGTTALFHACYRGDDDVARILLEANADIEGAESKSGNTPALVAAVDCNIELLTRLLREDADVDEKNLSGLSVRIVLDQIYSLNIDSLYVHALTGRRDGDFGIGDADAEMYIRTAFSARTGKYKTRLNLDDITLLVKEVIYDIPRLLRFRFRRVGERNASTEIENRKLGPEEEEEKMQWETTQREILLTELEFVLRMFGMHYARINAIQNAATVATAAASSKLATTLTRKQGLEIDAILMAIQRFRRLHILQVNMEFANKGTTGLAAAQRPPL